MLVTIGIPFRNAARTLPDAIRSVFAQTEACWELLLVDDGSTDDSPWIARSVRDDRVRVLSDGQWLGLEARLNQIIDNARGEFLARMDADDVMLPDRLARQVAFLRAHPDIDVVGSAAYVMDERDRVYGVRGRAPLDARLEAIARKGSPFVHPTVLGRLPWFASWRYAVAAPRAEDLELWLRSCRDSSFALIPDPLLIYREGCKGSSAAYRAARQTERTLLRSPLLSELPHRTRSLLAARSLAKEWGFAAGVRMGLEGWLLERRSAALPASDAARASHVLEGIRRTPVPGLRAAEAPR